MASMNGCESLDPTLRLTPSTHFDAVGLSLGSTIPYVLDTVPNTVGGYKKSGLQTNHHIAMGQCDVGVTQTVQFKNEGYRMVNAAMRGSGSVHALLLS